MNFKSPTIQAALIGAAVVLIVGVGGWFLQDSKNKNLVNTQGGDIAGSIITTGQVGNNYINAVAHYVVEKQDISRKLDGTYVATTTLKAVEGDILPSTRCVFTESDVEILRNQVIGNGAMINHMQYDLSSLYKGKECFMGQHETITVITDLKTKPQDLNVLAE